MMSINIDIKRGLKRLWAVLSVLWFGLCLLFLIGDEKSLFFLVILIPFAWGGLYTLFWVADGFKKKQGSDEKDLEETNETEISKIDDAVVIKNPEAKETFIESVISFLFSITYYSFCLWIIILFFDVAVYIINGVWQPLGMAPVLNYLGIFAPEVVLDWYQQPQSMFWVHKITSNFLKHLEEWNLSSGLFCFGGLTFLTACSIENKIQTIENEKSDKIREGQILAFQEGESADEKGDHETAYDRWLSSAELGYEIAFIRLSSACKEREDYIQEYMWHCISARVDRSCLRLERNLSLVELKEARDLASEWMAKHRTKYQVAENKIQKITALNRMADFLKNVLEDKEEMEGFCFAENILENNNKDIETRRRECKEDLLRQEEKLKELRSDLGV